MAKKNCTPCRIPPISTPSSTIKSIIPRCYIKSNRIMKKLALFLLMTAALSASAQDTLRVCSPRSNYLWTDWFDTTLGEVQIGLWGLAPEAQEGGIFFNTQDSLTIYGIAASFTTTYDLEFYLTDTATYHFYRWAWWPDDFDSAFLSRLPNDTVYLFHTNSRLTFDNCRQALRLYRAMSPNPEQVGEDLWVHLIDTPATYYLWMPLREYHRPPDVPIIMFPVFERYFSEPVTVVDSFYVGITNFPRVYAWPMDIPVFQTHGIPCGIKKAIHFVIDADKIDEWNYIIQPDGLSGLFLFPILTPPEGSSAVSAQAPEVLDRYVALQPNPATDRVTVTSSFGLTRIEVRDAAGRKLHDAPASGFSANLDLSRFPSGTLILTIHTPAGPATKKLLKP